ncbi:MAG TPA: aerotolerance regulator BatA [Flavobacteriales bacterium]|nr:aerotolerance regulator BatA [Flavobacteriales bacterium]
MEFANPDFFWLLLLVPLLVAWYVYQINRSVPLVKHPNVQQLAFEGIDFKLWIRHYPVVSRSLAFIFLIVALARPQSSMSWEDAVTEGIDIIIALDISGSMLAEDFKPNRLQAAKNVAMEFISGRPNDRIGLVIYSGESFTQCPLTIDHDVLKNLFGDVNNGMIEDGTAIGDGLATAVNRLKESDAKSKVVILLTDGQQTAGSIPPLTAAEIAKQFNVRVYSVGVGTIGTAPYPFKTPFGTIQYQDVPVNIDEPTLKGIAETTGGTYFRATDNKKLEEVYREIDKLERTKIEVTQYRKKSERYLPWAVLGLALLMIEFTLTNSIYRSIT